jgi:MYXO-CTERM domain-containing protein
MYVSAVRDPGTTATAFLLTSTDHGKTFVENPLPLVQTEHAAFIAAVDPLNADRLYVRTSNAVDMPSRLLVSDDAGKTFRTIFTGLGQLLGFALSSDGKKVYVGGPRDGLNQASTTDFAFTQKSKVEVQCLKLADDGLWTCSSEKSGFVVGLTKDEGATFESKLHFCDIRGPLTCPTGTSTNTECSLGGTTSTASPPWPQQRAVLGCSASSSSGGIADGGLDQDAANNPATPTADPQTGKGGCSVRAPSPTPIAALIAAVLAAVAFVRRRRR